MALAKALNAKTTVITVTEPLPVIEYVSGHAGGGISQQDWDAAYVRARRSTKFELWRSRSGYL